MYTKWNVYIYNTKFDIYINRSKSWVKYKLFLQNIGEQLNK